MMENSEDPQDKQKIPMIQHVASILWPSFITAGIANSLFFTFFDPTDLLYAGGYPPMTNIAVYSIGFFMFWLLTCCSCFITSYFLKPCSTIKS